MKGDYLNVDMWAVLALHSKDHAVSAVLYSPHRYLYTKECEKEVESNADKDA